MRFIYSLLYKIPFNIRKQFKLGLTVVYQRVFDDKIETHYKDDWYEKSQPKSIEINE